jgi:hypothetical protein
MIQYYDFAKLLRSQFDQQHWWIQAAHTALALDRCTLIRARNADELYLARFWLHEPRRHPKTGEPESGDSCMLHYFARPDDDDALHDHPWDFDTTCLSGGYIENEPEPGWAGPFGPRWNFATRIMRPGHTFRRKAVDLHRVSRIRENTWTLVRTGKRTRLWGFHPTGRVWQPAYDYLGITPEQAE